MHNMMKDADFTAVAIKSGRNLGYMLSIISHWKSTAAQKTAGQQHGALPSSRSRQYVSEV